MEIHGDEQMVMHSSTHFYRNWAKERLDEMDAILTSLEGKASVVQADARHMANNALADLRRSRDGFRDTVKKRAEASEAVWIGAKAKLEDEWNSFEDGVRKYVESFGKQIENQQATFTLQAAAQLKAWRDVANKLGNDAKQFAAEHRAEIDAAAAEEKRQKLNQAGTQSWSSLMAALTETRAAFDRANQAAREAFKRAA